MKPIAFRDASELPPMARSVGTMLWNHTGSWRFLRPRYQDKVAPCSEACPAGEDLAMVELLAGQGAFEEAWLRIREENPLPGVCGRVCHHPCETACNRGDYDEPVSINSLERYLADSAWKLDLRVPAPTVEASGRRVALIGAGPAGLTAGYFLRRLGHEVDLFDARQEPGGLLRYAIPEYRLPVDALSWEVGLILDDGVSFHPGRRLGADLTWEDLRTYDAVFVAVGAWTPGTLDVEGCERALDGLEFLELLRCGEQPQVQGPVAVIGGGNTALDVARSLLRLGASPTLFYRRRVEDMPALPDEIEEATDEGIPIRPLLAPHALLPGNDGVRLQLTPMIPVETGEGERPRVVPSGAELEEAEVAAVFTALGTQPSRGAEGLTGAGGLSRPVALHLRRVISEGPWANRPPVFLGGDLVNTRKAVVTAIASGKEAAVVIDAELRAARSDDVWPSVRVGARGAISMNSLAGGDRSKRQNHVVEFEELNTIYFQYEERKERPRITLEERRTGFDEVKMRISGSMAMKEAERCFHCGLCDQCDNCYLFCPDCSVLRDLRQGSRDIDYDYCKGCGVCVVECPRNAMVLEEEGR